MSNNAGLWIDHHKAFLVMMAGKVVTTKQIDSGVPALAGSTVGADASEPAGAAAYERFYDQVIERVHGVEALLILGPDEAKGELRARLDRHKHSIRMVDTETVDRMSDSQVVTRVRKRFHP
ncbi:MAG: hypothetical protein KAY61_04530 [Candidatus Eisenbacteria bacterium]|jgi:hypothetical protein|nr:hypothetical protein [Candidatus Eisenbacteria bacterium]